jgi:gluconate 2-dehydrogenase gamma chain
MSSPEVEKRDGQPADAPVSRRTVLKSIAAGFGAAATLPLLPEAAETAVQQTRPAAAAAARFFSSAERRTIEALSEIIIPADDHSPGAKAAEVVDFIDLLVSDSHDETERAAWKDGLAALDGACQQRHGKPFADLTVAQQTEMVAEMSRNELDPDTPLDRFFVVAKGATINGYYTSEIGIHQELRYKGNQFLPEFVGCTHPEHQS